MCLLFTKDIFMGRCLFQVPSQDRQVGEQEVIIKTENSTYTIKKIPKDKEGRHTLTSTNKKYPGPYKVVAGPIEVGRRAVFQFVPKLPQFRSFLLTSEVLSIK